MKYEDQWNGDIWKEPKLRNDAQLLNDYVMEPCYVINLKRRQRFPLYARFRASTFSSCSRSCQFKGTPEALVMAFCGLQVVEDEVQLVFFRQPHILISNSVEENILGYVI